MFDAKTPGWMLRATLGAVCCALLIAACGGSATHAEQMPQDARADASAVIDAHYAIVAPALLPVQGRTDRLLTSARKCNFGRVSPAVSRRIYLALFGLERFVGTKAAAPAYQRFAARVATFPTTFSPIVQVLRDVQAMAKQARRLARGRFDLCGLLIAWREKEWNRSFGNALFVLAYRRAGVDLAEADRIRRDARSAATGLKRIGLSRGEAMNLIFTVSFIP